MWPLVHCIAMCFLCLSAAVSLLAAAASIESLTLPTDACRCPQGTCVSCRPTATASTCPYTLHCIALLLALLRFGARGCVEGARLALRAT